MPVVSEIGLLAEAAPAGGAAIGQVIGMVVALTVGFSALVWLGEAHRRGRRTPLGTLAAFSARVGGLPQWAALPLAITGISLVGAFFGYMWDVSLHIDRGRDVGPFANPSHYFILTGLYGIIAAGYLSTVLTRPGVVPGRSAIRVSRDQYWPLGGVMIAAAGLFAFAGFPLDDVWHRLFGQDVTLWGPTHLVMLSGGLLTLIGVAVLFQEGVSVAGERRGRAAARSNGASAEAAKAVHGPLARLADWIPNVLLWPSRALIAGGFLAGLSIYQGEFDYGVPQFELVLQPLMIAGSAALSLVAARIWLGRGGALGAVGFYLVIRGAIWLLVGPILGETAPSQPLYVPEAILVELVALLLVRRPLIFGAVAGVAVGAIGFFAEWPWINAVMRIDWTSALLPEGPIVAAVAGAAIGTIGALLGLALRRELSAPSLRTAGGLAAGSLAVVIACFGFGLADRNVKGATAQVTLTDVKPLPDREVIATVRFDPPELVQGASWVRDIAWQGGGLVGSQMEEIGPGVYRSRQPLPVHDDWKTAIRVHNGHTLLGAGIYAPADPAIPVAAHPAVASSTAEMQPDRELLQRERKRDVPGWLWNAAGLVVLALTLAFLALLAWCLGRFAAGPREPVPTQPQKPGRSRAHVTVPGARA